MRLVILSAVALSALALTACNRDEPIPAGREVAGAMPDTDAARSPGPMMTAPDAAATGAAEPIPPEGGVGNVAGQTVTAPAADQ